jgi:formate-dependent nitrite reductase membrane component NrfD
MVRPWGHSASYHEWANSTPVIDAVGTILAVASVVIGTYAALFFSFALSSGDGETARENALFFVAIAAANGSLDALRHWRRHHG